MFVGSHDSAAHTIDFNVSFWNYKSKWEWIRIAAKHFSFIREIVVNMTKTQNLSIFEQLTVGAKILDLRVSRANNIFYMSHTFCCMELECELNEIVKYLNSDCDENKYRSVPIIILVKADFANRSTVAGHEEELLQLLKSKLEPYLQNGNISIYYEPMSIDIANYPQIKNLSEITNIWFNVDNVQDFINKFNNTDISNMGVSTLGCILTPNENLNISKLLKISLRQYADNLRPVSINLLSQKAKKKEVLPNYCSFDFVDASLVFEINNVVGTDAGNAADVNAANSANAGVDNVADAIANDNYILRRLNADDRQ